MHNESTIKVRKAYRKIESSDCCSGVFGAEINAADMTATSACQAANCSGLQSAEWVCFYSDLDWR